MRIKGGYYLKARCIQDSEIAHAPPHVREIWDWLLKEANHKTVKKHGQTYNRGEVLCTYNDIRDALHWMVGWRKMTYSKWDCEKAMKVLKKATMIATRKTTRGLLITICNYEYYQNPKNYESQNYTADTKATRKPQSTDTINKNEKNEKNDKKKDIEIPSWIPKDAWKGFTDMRKRIKAPLTDRAMELIIEKLEAFKKEGVDVGKILDQSTERSWRGIFPLKDGGSNAGTKEPDYDAPAF